MDIKKHQFNEKDIRHDGYYLILRREGCDNGHWYDHDILINLSDQGQMAMNNYNWQTIVEIKDKQTLIQNFLKYHVHIDDFSHYNHNGNVFVIDNSFDTYLVTIESDGFNHSAVFTIDEDF